MAQKMLIDATHAEETRVVVVDGNKLEEFDFETASRRQLAGNIYLAKVTRVEPSLQAAFVDYGGNRHGFLAFNEIHPDYYQIPAADRAALLEEERALSLDADEDDSKPAPKPEGGKRVQRSSSRRKPEAQAERTSAPDQVERRDISAMDIVEPEGDDDTDVIEGFAPVALPEDGGQGDSAEQSAANDDPAENALNPADADAVALEPAQGLAAEADGEVETAPGTDPSEPYRAADHATELDDRIEAVSDGEQAEEMRPRRKPRMRRYKIQEVIKVRQIMLVQVVKEERGNKGAALTTYLSLAGRYCVLMPNTARGGGISRKITNATDRAKLKAIAGEIKVPEGAGLIIRTAGAQRTKAEIKRDYEYLLRLWEQIRDLTLKSIAPTPIYEEGDLIKRSIRDLYSKNIDEVLVEGEAGYRTAKDFMKMIMPSHARNVKPYTDPLPLFARYQVESTLAAMFNPTVQLPSGGYIVIGITEALVAIDINSGRATREGSIEETALKTNLEAAAEIARQLRLRDLAGLIVIDFIDMEERKNNAAVEKMLKDKLKNDRARIQVGRISGFGLLEMSRQRLRPGMLEATTQPCPHCHGTGLIRSDDSMGLTVLRQIEEEGTRGKSREVLVRAPAAVVNFIINQKREHLAMIELRYGMAVRLEADPRMVSPDFEIERFKTATRVPVTASEVISINTSLMPDLEDDEDDSAPEAQDASVVDAGETSVADDARGDSGARKKRRRRRRRRGGVGANGEGTERDDALANGGAEPDDAGAADQGSATQAPEPEGPSEPAGEPSPEKASDIATADSDQVTAAPRRRARKPAVPATADAETHTEGAAAAPKAPARRRRKPAAKVAPAEDVAITETGAPQDMPADPASASEAILTDAISELTSAPNDAAQDDPAAKQASGEAEPPADLAAADTDDRSLAPLSSEGSSEQPVEQITGQNGAATEMDSAAADVSDLVDRAADDKDAADPAGSEPEDVAAATDARPKRSGWWSVRS